VIVEWSLGQLGFQPIPSCPSASCHLEYVEVVFPRWYQPPGGFKLRHRRRSTINELEALCIRQNQLSEATASLVFSPLSEESKKPSPHHLARAVRQFGEGFVRRPRGEVVVNQSRRLGVDIEVDA
jgi:hypothetical protein